jgi:hypothetical protein
MGLLTLPKRPTRTWRSYAAHAANSCSNASPPQGQRKVPTAARRRAAPRHRFRAAQPARRGVMPPGASGHTVADPRRCERRGLCFSPILSFAASSERPSRYALICAQTCDHFIVYPTTGALDEAAEALQRVVRSMKARFYSQIQAAGTRSVRACLRSVAGCAPSTGSAGHAGATADLELTFNGPLSGGRS